MKPDKPPKTTDGYVKVDWHEDTARRSAKGTEGRDRRPPNMAWAKEVLAHK